MDTFSKEFWTKFHEARQKAKEEAAATGTPMPDDLQLMATISDGLSCNQLYGAGPEAAHLRVESSQVAARLPLCCFEAEQRIMKQVEIVVSSVYAAFDKYIRLFTK
ncbi:hypothetical protein M9H77_17709 [Catharanthus roseus]|uniref:Uncharacterized protein n=1 Tax=Catharanthus roseus TaxID=4058 RepID=A0ACC0B5E3_CATRO|nr:hypothetical protein M9H77_17709 [Catharanthus roseus]